METMMAYTPPPGRPVSSPPSDDQNGSLLASWLTYRDIMDLCGLKTVEAAAARVRRAGWERRTREGTDQVEILVPHGALQQPAKRRYRRVTDAEIADIFAAHRAGMNAHQIGLKFDRDASTVRYILAGNEPAPDPAPHFEERPVREPGETKHRYAARVMHWMMQTSPTYRERVLKKRSAAIQRRARRLKRLKEREARKLAEAIPVPPPPASAVVELPVLQPVEMPPPRPTLLQRLMGWFR